LRLLTENFCCREETAVLPELGRRAGKGRHQWHSIFVDAMQRHKVLKSYNRSLNEAVEAFITDTSASEVYKHHLKHVASENLLRMFREWRKGLTRGVTAIEKFDRDSFWTAISSGDPTTSATVFVSLSRETRKKICREYEGLRNILVSMSNEHALNNPLPSP
jgi:hypothetical protein